MKIVFDCNLREKQIDGEKSREIKERDGEREKKVMREIERKREKAVQTVDMQVLSYCL